MEYVKNLETKKGLHLGNVLKIRHMKLLRQK